MAEDEIKYFPEELTVFSTKKDAAYSGDPEGDYVLAKHINDLQDAILRVEKSIGTRSSSSESLVELINDLSNERPMRVDSVGYFTGNLTTDMSYTESILGQYKLVLLENKSNQLIPMLASLKEKDTAVYGIIDATDSLVSIQNEIASWKQLGVAGVFLKDFGGEESPTRAHQQNIIDSVEQEQIKLGIIPVNINRLIDDSPNESYNPIGRPFVFPVDTIMQLRPFAYNEGYQEIEQMTQTVMPLVLTLRQRGLDIMGWSAATTQKQYEYTQAGALIFGLDYLYNGNPIGETLTTRTPLFDWPSLFSVWKTDMPIVFNEGQSIVRRVNNGTIRLFKDKSIELSGLEIPSTLIKWVQNSIPGSTIQDASITPDKLSTYDIQRIVNLLNDAPEEIQIDSTRIKMDEGGLGLPVNIPPSNMKQNVIQAINQKNNESTLEFQYIEDYSIKSISGPKITGDIQKDQMVAQVIQAINEASNQDVFISVPKASIVDLRSTGTIDGNVLTGDNFTFRQGQLTEGLTTEALRVNGYLEGNDGEFLSLYIQNLEVETLSGLENLDLKNLTADSMTALVGKIVELEADNAQIGSLVSNTISTGSLNAELITAINSITDLQITNSGIFGDAVITSASIQQIDASKISTGTIDTDEVTLSSKDGHLTIESSHIRIYSDLDNNENRKLRTAIGYVGDLISTDEINLHNLKTNLALKNKELLVADETEKASIQKEIDEVELAITSLEELIASRPDGYEDSLYGLVVMGDDGETRLFDHTGVYSAGIKDNAISNEKLQEDSIDDRVIRAGSITARSIHGETITGDLIAGATIVASDKLVAKSIVSELIQANAIEASHIKAGAIIADKIDSGAIGADHIQAGAISSEKLTIGFQSNIMNMGFDSFEQEVLGSFTGILETQNQVTITWPNGEKETTDFIQDNKWRFTKPSDITLSPGQEVVVEQVINGIKVTANTVVYSSYDVPPTTEEGPLTIEPVSNRRLVLEGKAQGSLTRAEVSNEWYYDGRYSLAIQGNQTRNSVRLGTQYQTYPVIVYPGTDYFLSVYAWTGRQTTTPVRIGIKYKGKAIDWSPVLTVSGGIRPTRLIARFTSPEDAIRASVIISVEASNSITYFDAVKLEEIEEGKTEPGPFRPTATTVISGDNITTGRIDARHIHIGEGSIFGHGDVIDITDEGIIARSKDGRAMLNSKGLEITGGAFQLTSGVVGDKSFRIADGVLTAETPLNLIVIDPDKGFSIISKKNEQILFDTDPKTGEIRMSGTFKVYSNDDPEMSWTVEDKLSELERDIQSIQLTPGPDGKTAYEIALEEGFIGSRDEWIESLIGRVGASGKTAYQIALGEGFIGNQQQWLNSLVGQDAYKLEILSTRGNQAVNGEIDTLFYAKLYRGKTDITESTDKTHFNWVRMSDNPTSDTNWNNLNKGKKEVHVTSNDIDIRATFRCNVVGL